MHVVVPFAVTDPKTRLAPVLSSEEREAFARAMLTDVLEGIEQTGYEPTILATAPLEADFPVSTSVLVDDRPLTPAVNAVLETTHSDVAIVMADLALATSGALEGCFSRPGDVVIAPGRGGGTNVLVSRHEEFRVDYHGTSYLDHCRAARDVGAAVSTVDSFRLSTDVDEPEDLVEVTLHGGEHSRSFLERHGFDLETTAGRVTVTREERPKSDPG